MSTKSKRAYENYYYLNIPIDESVFVKDSKYHKLYLEVKKSRKPAKQSFSQIAEDTLRRYTEKVNPKEEKEWYGHDRHKPHLRSLISAKSQAAAMLSDYFEDEFDFHPATHFSKHDIERINKDVEQVKSSLISFAHSDRAKLNPSSIGVHELLDVIRNWDGTASNLYQVLLLSY
jgi:hypothetical protein|tara:strand:+ start:452 stop:973 length:522 start_codon:yes stop_codon:yes gene_type:complete